MLPGYLHKSILFATLFVCFTIVFCSCDTKKTSTNVNAGATISAPTNLVATRNTATSVTIQWQDHSSNETGFRLERSVISAQSGFILYASLDSNIVQYIDTMAIADRPYYYRVCAVVDPFQSPYSDVATVASVALTPPSNLTATRFDTNRVTLQWQDNSSYESGFLIERSIVSADSGFIAIDFTTLNSTTYIDTISPTNFTIYYRICAVMGTRYSAYSNVCIASTFVLNAPSNLTANRTNGSGVTLSWQDNSNDENGFQIERSTQSSSNGFLIIRTVASNTFTFVDSSALGDWTYYYRIRAMRGSFVSSYSNVVTVPLTFSDSPSILTVIRINNRIVTIYWQDNSSNENGFQVERSTQNFDTTYVVLQTVTRNALSFIDSTALGDRTYYYRVCAIFGSNHTPYSNVGSVPPMTINAPTNVYATRIDVQSATVQWQVYSSNANGFIIERSNQNSYSGFTQISSVGENATSYIDNNVSADTSYYYRIKAVLGSLNSSYSNSCVLPINYPPNPIQYVNPLNQALNQYLSLDLSWLPATDPEGDSVHYRVYLSRMNGSANDSLIATGLAVTHVLTGHLDPNTQYRWYVLADDPYHVSHPVGIENELTFTTGNYIGNYIDWSDLPHNGTVTLTGRFSESSHSSWYPGGSSSYDTSYPVTAHTNQSQFFLLPQILSFGSDTLATFPLVATSDNSPHTISDGLGLFVSDNLISGMTCDHLSVTTEDVTVGSIIYHCIVLNFNYYLHLEKYAISTTQHQVRLYFAPSIGLVRTTTLNYHSSSQMSQSSSATYTTDFTIVTP